MNTISAQETPSEAPATAPARPRPQVGELFPFVLPWDDASDSVANVARWSPTPAGRNGFVFMKDGHLWEPSVGAGPTAKLVGNTDPADPRRIRFLGVNLCFNANFPTHEEAPKIAARMAKFGINCVRFHHMDFFAAPRGILKEDMKTLDPEMMDRLDFFIAELKKCGIYSDLNLHVARVYPGFPSEWKDGPSFHKGVDQFHPAMIQMQKDYARDLLTHVNPYTGARYLDEPAVAFVEINNENGLMTQWSWKDLDFMPDELAAELNKQWTRWLLAKYPPGQEPEPLGPVAWAVKEVPMAEELLKALPEAAPAADPWLFEQHSGGKAAWAPQPEGWSRISIETSAPEKWQIQLSHAGLSLQAGEPYTFEAEVQASEGLSKFDLVLGQSQEPWEQHIVSSIPVSQEVQKIKMTLISPATENGTARIVLSGFGKLPPGAWIQFRGVSLKHGGMQGVDLTSEALNYRFLTKTEFPNATLPQKQDWIDFLWQTEDDYWREMDQYLRDELGVKSLLIGTQAYVFSNAALQSRFPVVDTHGYWHHPEFPGKSWSPTDYIVRNEAMSARTDGGELSKLGVNRVKDRAFVVTEYNHPNPMTFAAEAFPLLAAMAAWQDWDGIFPFAYSHGGEWNDEHVHSFFDIKQDPLKMATLPMAAAVFLRGDLGAVQSETVGPVSASAFRNAMLSGSTAVDATKFGASREDMLSRKLELAIGEPDPNAVVAPLAHGQAHFRFIKPPGADKSLAVLSSARSKGVIGHTQGAEFDLGDGVKLAGVNTRIDGDWAVVTLSQMTGESVAAPGRVLLLAMSDQQATGMQWVDEKTKESVSNNWGKAPQLVEGITATVTLPLAKDRVQVWSLDERGQPLEALPITGDDKSAVISLKPEYATIWYEVIVQ